MSTKEEVIQRAEELHQDRKLLDAHNYLLIESEKPEFSNEPEILWRSARGYFDASEAEKDKEKKKELVMKGNSVAEKALQYGPEVAPCHKWYGIMLSMTGEYISTKDKIGNAFKIKEHALKANELSPKDASTLHMLGRWCYDVSSIGWVERKVASAVFASPPESTYQEAIKYFLEAQEVEPTFIRNALLIGDSYTQLKDTSKANEWYKKCSEMQSTNDIDKSRIEEAKKKIK